MVEIFKTNIKDALIAKQLIGLLMHHLPQHQYNFDLHDCDNILRVAGNNIAVNEIVLTVESNGYSCEWID